MSDHVKQTLALLRSIKLDTSEDYGQSTAERKLRLRLAEVHATLELAKQARIANLIKILNGRREDFTVAAEGHIVIEGMDSIPYSLDELSALVDEVRVLVREGLDLK